MIEPAPDPLPPPTGLADVPWDTLRHAYGTADDVPGLLAAAFGADEDAALAAIGDLDAAVFHQGGGICGAAPAVLPFLVALVADAGRARQVRRDTLDLVFQLVVDAVECDPEYVHADWPAALSAQVPCLEGLLDDPDALLRREAADVLSWAVGDAARVLSALHGRWRREEDPLTRLTLLADAADLLDRHPDGEAFHDTAPGAPRPAVDGVPAPAVSWLVDRARFGSPDERTVLLSTDVLAPAFPDGLRLAHEAVEGLAREEAPLWAAARRHDPATREHVAAFAPNWLLRAFGGDPAGHGDLAGRMLGGATAHLRQAGLNGVADLVAALRSAEGRWAPALAGLLADPEEHVRSRAALVLAVCGPAAVAPWADRLALLAGGPPGEDANHALYALARLGDDRVVGLLGERADVGFGFPRQRGYADGWSLGPHLADLLGTLAAFADDLVPTLRSLLRSDRDEDERAAVVGALGAWGEAAAPLAPELADAVRDLRHPQLALEALAAIGPAASVHAGPVLDRARGGEVLDGLTRRDALYAYWRMTGDADTVLELFDSLPDERFTATGLRLLGEIGPPAARHAAAVREGVPESGRSGPWALLALWRVAGERDGALRRIMAGPYLDGRHGVDALRTVRILARMGAGAREALPRLRARLARDERVRHAAGSGLRDVLFDHEYTAAVRAAVARIESGAVPE
ncbi:hypothetical protein [Nocardiopsis sp. NRRL B-16309]|uniref:hypothetical protein n=1 Tax=Nocardiopsis sp. NRRL B-16309 TaxID=1519494 RepID=UPI0006AE4511|nr:hypothetical protein [Nocardiopsis sp. NRRL B-16309]KOX11299.1 hypothetical protein ADL05_24050 [Nocardiopsis sp. NRRL B-16309]